MNLPWKTARWIAVLSLILVAGSVSANTVMAQDPTATVVTEVSTQVPTVAPMVDEKDDGFDDWGLLGLLGLLGLAGLRRKPKVEVQPVNRTVEPPVTRTVVEPPADRTRP